MKNNNKTFADIIVDMRQRAAVALRQDADAMIHHNAVGGMLSALAYEAETAHKREVEKLRGEIAGLREKMGDDDLLKMARDIEKMAREIAAKDAKIKKLRECLNEAADLRCVSKSCDGCFFSLRKCVTYKWRKALEGGHDDK